MLITALRALTKWTEGFRFSEKAARGRAEWNGTAKGIELSFHMPGNCTLFASLKSFNASERLSLLRYERKGLASGSVSQWPQRATHPLRAA